MTLTTGRTMGGKIMTDWGRHCDRESTRGLPETPRGKGLPLYGG